MTWSCSIRLAFPSPTRHHELGVEYRSKPRRFLHGVSPQIAAYGYSHRRCISGRRLPGAEGYSFQRGPGYRGGLPCRADPALGSMGDRANGCCVWEDRCISAQGKQCGLCAKACPYGSINYEVGKAAEVVTAKCHGCGGCVAECPHNAITQTALYRCTASWPNFRQCWLMNLRRKFWHFGAIGAPMAVRIWPARAISSIPPMSAACG